MDEQLTVEEFVAKYCHNCGSQRCEGIGTEWFDGCRFRDCLRKDVNPNVETTN